MTSPMPLQAHGLSVELGGRPVLSGIDVELRPGEILSVVGPNGSGKTTLLRTLLGLQPSRDGEVQLLGRPVRELRPTARARRAAWMPQEERPSENLSVEEYVSLARFPHIGAFGMEDESDRRAVDDALRDCDLETFRERGVLDLSGGERQRVLFARALAQASPVLVLDEPTSHLDMARQFEVMAYLDRFRTGRPDRAVLVAMHDLNLASRFANRLLWLARGQLVAVGSPSATVTAERIFQVFGVETVVEHREGQVVVFPPRPALAPPSMGGHSLRVHVICGGGSGEEILRALTDAGHSISAGALNLLDSDEVLARELHVSAAVEAPFSRLSDTIRAENRAVMSQAEVVVIAPLYLGPANVANLEDLLGLPGPPTTYLVDGPPLSGRDFTAGAATRLVAELERRGAVHVSGVPRLLELLQATARARGLGEAGASDAPAPRGP